MARKTITPDVPPAVPLPPQLPPALPTAPPPAPPVYQPAPVRRLSGKTFFVVAAIILMVTTILGWLLYGLKAGQLDTANNLLAGQADQIDDLKATATASKEQITDLQVTVDDLEGQNDTLSDNLSTNEKALDKYEGEISNLSKIISCNINQPADIDFTSNTSVSESLKIMIGELDSEVIEADWHVLGNNSSDAMHYLTTSDYTYIFIIYYANSYNTENNIFFVNGECFLNTSD